MFVHLLLFNNLGNDVAILHAAHSGPCFQIPNGGVNIPFSARKIADDNGEGIGSLEIRYGSKNRSLHAIQAS
jgi:hypothetical protein